MNKTTTRFQRHLKALGDDEASELYAITKRSAQAYRLGERSPKVADIPKLIKCAKGSLSYSCFFEAAND